MKNNFLDTLESRLDNLTNSQRKVVDYVLKNPTEVSYLTLKQLAKKVNLSTTTIMRLTYHLGYKGYSDFQKGLQYSPQDNARSPKEILDFNTMNSLYQSKLISNSAENQINNIKETLSYISDDKINRCIDEIERADTIYITGARSSFSTAHFLYQGLNQTLENCVFLNTSNNDIVENTLKIKKTDLLIAISFPRYFKQTVSIVESAKNNGAKVISITDSYSSPIAISSNIVLPCSFKSLAFHVAINGGVFIADFLITSIAIKNINQTKSRLDTIEKILPYFDTLNVQQSDSEYNDE